MAVACRPIADRLIGKYEQLGHDECWPWSGGVAGGYGVIWNNDQQRCVQAHRAMYEIHVGPIPDGLVLCHECDNKLCVNPSHLWPGTVSDNARDLIRKGYKPVNTIGLMQQRIADLEHENERLRLQLAEAVLS